MKSTALRFCALGMLIACSDRGEPTDDDKLVPGPAVQHNVTETGIVDQVSDRADVTVYRFGRGDIQPTKQDTQITFNITGMKGWGQSDSLQIVSPNTGMAMVGPENELARYPLVGETEIRGQTLNWKTVFAPVIDAAKGDSTIITQLVSTGTGARRYSAIARAGTAFGFTVNDGHPGTLAAALAPVVPDRVQPISWKGSAFAALASEAGTGARPAAAATVAISALPDAIARNNDFYSTFYTQLPNLVVFAPLPGTTDLEHTVVYGNPFTTLGVAWTELVTVVYSAIVPVATDSGVGTLPARFVTALPVGELPSGGALRPAISPVRNVKINDASLAAAVVGVGGAPTLSWDAPALGTATTYAVVIHAIATGGGVNPAAIARYYTRATSLQLPPSALAPSGLYVATITAIAAPSADLGKQPFVGTVPFASADHVTATFTP